MILLKNTLRQELEKAFPSQELAQWFDPLAVAVDESGKILNVSFPHAFFGQWFMETRRKAFELHVTPHINGMRIVYENGNKVASSDGAYPLMRMDGTMPDNIDYDHYIKVANSMLTDVGYDTIPF